MKAIIFSKFNKKSKLQKVVKIQLFFVEIRKISKIQEFEIFKY